jgi:hypothetical protein
MYDAGHLSRYGTICPNAEQLTRHAVGCRLEAFAATAAVSNPSVTASPERSHP